METCYSSLSFSSKYGHFSSFHLFISDLNISEPLAFFNLSGKVFQIFEELGMRYFEIHGKLLLLQALCIQHYFLDYNVVYPYV